MSEYQVLSAILIFFLRIGDVSIGTLRTIFVVQGKTAISVILGFFEVIIWITAVSQVFVGIEKNPLLVVGYAAGFATGNAVGIIVERKLAMGQVVVRIISPKPDEEIIASVEEHSLWTTTFEGTQKGEPITLFYVICQRKDVPELLASAHKVDADLFYMVEPLRQSKLELNQPLPHATGWRSVIKMK